MTGPVLPLAGRCQSRGFAAPNGMLFGVAASCGFDTPPLGEGIRAHAQGAFARMTEVLDAAGLQRSDVCSVTVYLDDVIGDVAGFNEVWQSYFAGLAPARCCIGARLQMGMLVEMTFCAERRPGTQAEAQAGITAP